MHTHGAPSLSPISGVRPSWLSFLGLLLAALLVVVGLGISPASALWPPAAPTQQDYGCVKWDRYKVPENDDVAYYVNGQGVPPDTWISTAGAAHIDVVAKHWNGSTQTFPLTFTAEPDSSCGQAQNEITATKGTCNSGDMLWNVHVSVVNTADATGWPLPPGSLVDFDPQFPAYGAQFRYDSEVADGQSATGTLGLPPGTYKVYEVLPSGDKVYRFTTFIDGKCGSAVVSSYDPNYAGGSNGSGASAGLVKATAKKVKVRLVNRGVKSATTFQVTVKPKGKKAKVVTRTVAKGAATVVTVRAKEAVKVIVRANGKVVLKTKLTTS